jgi:4-amino-4-deoxy-L-arabinose transferase-like glycosyltransferase
MHAGEPPTVLAIPFELGALLAGAGVLYLWRLDQNGWANVFYSAADRSMSTSSHDFLYASFDPGGVMTVDKPPLALWVQTASVKAFGFHPLSILVPQALIGLVTVALVYDLARRRFGRAAGFAAGLGLATTPITVAIARHNNPDALLILCCTAAVWCTVRGLEAGRTRWIVLAGLCVGLGFETKMAAALLVAPGLTAAWLWVAPRGRRAAAGQRLRAGAVMVVVAGAWPLLASLTPARDRPWISGTSDNSVWSLMLGYNGVGRLAGQRGGPGTVSTPHGGGGLFGGAPGPLRLLDTSLGGQAGWLLGLALVGALAVAWSSRLRRPDPRTGWLLGCGGAFATIAVAFSSAHGIFHPYYVSLLAPFTAALAGGGLAQVVRSDGAARVLAPLAVVAAAVTETVVVHNNPERIGWMAGVLPVAAAVAAALLAAARGVRAHAAVLALAFAGLLAAPTAWAVETLDHPTSKTFPAGGPVAADVVGSPGVRRLAADRARGLRPRLSPTARRIKDAHELSAAVRYVRRHGGGTIGVRSQEDAAWPIIRSDARVAGLGGFSGVESELRVPWFASAVRAGRVRWVLVNGRVRIVRGRRIGAARVLLAMTAACPRLRTRTFARGRWVARGALYDCRHRATALMHVAHSAGRLAVR